MRMQERSVSREAILTSVDSYEIIEEYPDDRELPSFLVYAETNKSIIHILFAVDRTEKNVRIVTAYEPNIKEWGEDMKERRN